MTELKTKKTGASVEGFLNTIQNAETREDCLALTRLMTRAVRSEPRMWGTGIVGFGSRRLKYASGRELDWMLMGFSPRKANIALYIPGGVARQASLLKKLGKHTTGKGCLYIRKLSDVDQKVLKELLSQSARAASASEA